MYQKRWAGTVSAPGQNVTLHFGFEKPFFGKLKCDVSIPQQHIFELPASECLIRGDSLYLEFSDGMTAKYKARMGNGQIPGKWIQGDHTFPLTLNKSERTLFQLYAEYALHIAEQNALNRKDVDWVKLNKMALRMTEDVTSADQLIPVLQLILQNLRDKHGFVFFNSKSMGYETDDFKNISPALRQAAYGNDKDIVSVRISDSVAYLRIPKFVDSQPGMDKKYNEEIQRQVCVLMDKNVSSWIVDLRLNYGGNMFAMLGGLNKLFGDGKIGSFTDKDGKESGGWIMKGGDFYEQQEQKTSSGIKCNARLKPGKIAILTGPVTASSGEAVAVALRGLNNSKIFGEPTKGFTSSLSGLNVGKGIVLFISTGYYSDGKGRVYNHGVTPDIPIKDGDNFNDILKDKKVTAAIKWITE
ncbi:S41 family peptidase [Dyadobacter sediminis]|uniref:S41 family peptidase n=1 Tax=Dyadobacter sediminis TaxID=1493691 RepID=UPI00148744D9|nr:S41 family peptidase [Dyadobacter sediminis]